MRETTVFVKVGGEDVGVCGAYYHLDDGGVFVSHEDDRDGGDDVTHHRIGTLDPVVQERVRQGKDD